MIFICFKNSRSNLRYPGVVRRAGGGGLPYFWNPSGNRSRGVGIVCNISLDFEALEIKRDFDCRLINLKLSIHDWQLQIMSIYAPNDPGGMSEFFSGLWRYTFPGIPLFIGGDFNCIDSLELDKAGGDYLAGDKGSVELKDFADSLSLCDVFRVKFPKRKLFTRHNRSNTNMSRIDTIYAPKSMISDAFGYTFDPCSYFDHDLVSVKFNCKQRFDRGPGLWKFNSSLTMDDEYTGLLSQFLQDWRLQKGRYTDLRTWWDIGKTHIRDIAIEFATSERREKRFQMSNLVRKLSLAEQEPVPSAGVTTDLTRQIRDIDEEVIPGVIVRSKELWVEQGEKPTKYFLNLEKMRQQKRKSLS